MKKEIELQLIIKNPDEVERKLRKIGKFVGARKQIDKYFVPPYRNFFEKEPYTEYLRVRFEKNKNHLNYSFLHFDRKGWLMATDEYETLVEKPKIVEQIFKKIGLIPKVTVIKTRKYFDCGNFEVTLDKVKGLGNFMEIEAKRSFGSIAKTRKACLDFLKKLNVKYEMRIQMGYPRMLYRKLEKRKSKNAKN